MEGITFFLVSLIIDYFHLIILNNIYSVFLLLLFFVCLFGLNLLLQFQLQHNLAESAAASIHCNKAAFNFLLSCLATAAMLLIRVIR